MGTDGKGGGVRGVVSFLLFGFPKRQRGGRWTDSDSLLTILKSVNLQSARFGRDLSDCLN
ncbi:hypothetical protein SLEP1_g2668 [Rubroshorea leprosula]|uniref:Uncharacterized protein n=1 Tax=Rubroshorea leprosula TaxID=152421 RepID=A0AAV5HR75_9ROSI|nr:hypothetical protein SLEP1_g2668 [Rubroshorea leprosula]